MSTTKRQLREDLRLLNAQCVIIIAQRDLLKSALQAVVDHANQRQRIATAGMEDAEIHRLDEPDFVQKARSALEAKD